MCTIPPGVTGANIPDAFGSGGTQGGKHAHWWKSSQQYLSVSHCLLNLADLYDTVNCRRLRGWIQQPAWQLQWAIHTCWSYIRWLQIRISMRSCDTQGGKIWTHTLPAIAHQLSISSKNQALIRLFEFLSVDCFIQDTLLWSAYLETECHVLPTAIYFRWCGFWHTHSRCWSWHTQLIYRYTAHKWCFVWFCPKPMLIGNAMLRHDRDTIGYTFTRNNRDILIWKRELLEWKVRIYC